MNIGVVREYAIDAPLDVVTEIGNDWTHFVHLHRKSHLEFRLLHKSGNREMFLYKARLLYPFPFFTPFLVVREYAPELNSYRQVYLNLRNGRVHYLTGSNFSRDDGSVQCFSDYLFSVSSLWRVFPKLFVWLFKRRMQKVIEEDMHVIRERQAIGVFDNLACAPNVPSSFHVFDELMSSRPTPDVAFTDRDTN